MPPVKKIKQLPLPLERDIAIDALGIFFLERKIDEIDKTSHVSNDDRKIYVSKLFDLKGKFLLKYKQEYLSIINDNFLEWEDYLKLSRPIISPPVSLT